MIKSFQVGSGSVSVWGEAGQVYAAGCFDHEAEAKMAVEKLAGLGIQAAYKETEAGWNISTEN